MWIVLAFASVFELGFTVFMKLSEGLRIAKYTVLTVVSVCLSIGLLSLAVTKLPKHKSQLSRPWDPPTPCGRDSAPF